MSLHGKNRLLYVRLANAEHPPGDVEWVRDDLAFGYVGRYSDQPVREIYMEGWQPMFERTGKLCLS